MACHLHSLDVELDDPALGADPLEVVAKALAAVLVFAGPDIQGLARLQADRGRYSPLIAMR